MNKEQIALRKIEREKYTMAFLAKFDTFSLGEAWTRLGKGPNYSWLASILLRWWREGLLERQDKKGNWHKGHVFSQCKDRSFWGKYAIYRWVDEDPA